MDHFGIGIALRGMLSAYRAAARRSGRTTSLVDSVKNGDRIVFAAHNEARHVEGLLRERKIEVKCVVVDPHSPYKILEHGSLSDDGRTIFDHHWLEQFYAIELDHAIEMVDRFERETSGHGAVHRETARQLWEASRWPR